MKHSSSDTQNMLQVQLLNWSFIWTHECQGFFCRKFS